MPSEDPKGTSESLFLEEWKECRTSIHDFDHHLTHLESYSVLATISLLAIGGFFTAEPTPGPQRGLIIEVLALALLFAEYYLANHYRGYLHAAVKRAITLECYLLKNIPLEGRPTVMLREKQTTDGMISKVIALQRERIYSFQEADAHKLLFLLLFAVDAALIVFTLFAFSATGLNIIFPLLIGTVLFLAGLYFLAVIRVGWNKRSRPKFLEELRSQSSG